MGSHTGSSGPTFGSKFNPKRGEVTYRIGKEGTSAFLLFGMNDLIELRTFIDSAIRGQHDHAGT